MGVVWRLIRTQIGRHKRALAVMFLLTAIVAATPYVFSMLGKWLVDEALQVTGPPKPAGGATSTDAAGSQAGPLGIEWKANSTEEKLQLLLLFLVASLGLHVLTTGLGAASELINSRTVHGIVYDLRTAVHDKLARLDMRQFEEETVGQLMTRVMDDSAGIPGNLTHLAITFSTQVAMLVMGLALLVSLNVTMTWIALATLPFYALVCVVFLPRIRDNTEDIRRRVATFNGFVLERLTNVLTIKNYAQEDREVTDFGERLDGNLGLARRQNRLNVSFNTLTTLITGVGTLAVLAYGFANIKAGAMTLGEVLAFYQVTAQLFVPIAALVSCASVAQTIQVLGQRVYDVLDRPLWQTDATRAVEPEEIKGAVSFEHVSLRYVEGGPFAVEDLSLDVPAGGTVCLVGPTGAGRRTLLLMLARLYEPTAGVVRLDGMDVRDMPLRTLRRAVRHVPRSCQVFTGTLAENICYGNPRARRNEIEAVAGLVDLHEFAAGLPDGYETRLGRGGTVLSPTQLAQLGLARALVTKPAVLTMDDVLSTVEEDVEKRLLAAARQALADRTILMTTSRLTVCEHADLVIVVMRKGRILQVGTHLDLLARPGTYRRMYMRQMGMGAVAESL